MKGAVTSIRAYADAIHDGWILAGMTAYFLTITLLIPSPGFPGAPGFPVALCILWASIPLGIGLLKYTPASVTAGFVLASLVPYNHVSVIMAFGLGTILGVKTLFDYRSRFDVLVKQVFVAKGFYFLVALVVYSVAVWLLRLGDSTDSWSFLALASSLLTVPFGAYSLSYLPWTDGEAKRAARLLCYAGLSLAFVAAVFPAISGSFEQYKQAFFVLYKSINTLIPLPFTMEWVDPDFNRVSLTSSHYLAAIMLLFAAAMASMAWKTKRTLAYGTASVLGLYCFALGENAHIVPGALAGLLAAGLVVLLSRNRGTVRAGFVSLLVVAIAFGGTVLVVAVLYFNQGRYSLSQKAALYSSVVERGKTHPLRLVVGEGPAAYASRAANKRLPQQRMDIEYAFPFAIPDFASPGFSAMVEKAANAENGSTMKRPLSGAAGILMEWGWLGTALILFVVFRMLRAAVRNYRRTQSASLQALVLTGLFGFVLLAVSLSVRTYFEYPELTSVVSVILMLAVSANSEGKAERLTTRKKALIQP